MRITLDTNCLLDLELNEGSYINLQNAISTYNSGRIELCVPGIGASERQKGNRYANTFLIFKERLKRISKKEIEILMPPCYVNISYIDWCIVVDDKKIELERRIHNVLFPECEFMWEDQATKAGFDPNKADTEDNKELIKWRNRKCDVLGLWCHIHYKNDIFVTNDKNFHKETKKPSLIILGAKNILFPSELLL